MSNLFNAIRSAVLPGSNADAITAEIEGQPGADALIPEAAPELALANGGNMSVASIAAGAAHAVAGVVPAAAGGGEGFSAAMDRITSVLSADGIKGDAGRMSAAMELAASAPAMTAEAVVAFVASNIPAAGAAPEPQAQQATASYEQQRVAAAALAMPSASAQTAKAGPMINRDAIFAARRSSKKEA